MPRRTSLYLSDAMDAELQARGEGAAGRAIERYTEVCRRHLPTDLSPDEWRLICDALNGVVNEPSSHVSVAWAGVADAIRLNGLARKWKVDGDKLIARLRAAPFAEILAIVDYAERFWEATSRGENLAIPDDEEGRTKPARRARR